MRLGSQAGVYAPGELCPEGIGHHSVVTRPKQTKRAVHEQVAQRLWDALREVEVAQQKLIDESGVPQSSASKFMNVEKGMETENLLRFLRAAGDQGINLHSVIMGRGPLVFVPVITDQANLVEAAHHLVDRLAATSGSDGGDDGAGERVGARGKRRKP